MASTVIYASVPSGFERCSLEEVQEKIPGVSETSMTRGHTQFRLPSNMPQSESIKLLKSLRSVDNLYVVIGTVDIDFSLKKDMKSGLIPILESMSTINWQPSIEYWREFVNFEEDLLRDIKGEQLANVMDTTLISVDEVINRARNPSEKDKDKTAISKPPPVSKPRKPFSFRATCSRSGEGHLFGSNDVAYCCGGLLHDGFGWPVDLKNYNMEVVIMVKDNAVSYCIALTQQSMHKRKYDADFLFSNMTLRSTISYNMLRLCGVEVGEIVIDPMCGSGAIIAESMMSEFGRMAFHIAGDLGEGVIESRVRHNIELAANRPDLAKSVKGGDCMTFNVYQLPFKTASIDVVIADMPFGRRCGSTNRNKWLYPAALKEFARVLVPSTGRACLLTADTKNLNAAIWRCQQQCQTEENDDETTNQVEKKPNNFWVKPYRSFTIHHGGLNPMVYLLRRSTFLIP